MTETVSGYARTSSGGTAMTEAALCAEHYVEPHITTGNTAAAEAMDESRDKSWHDATDNPELACIICGRPF